MSDHKPDLCLRPTGKRRFAYKGRSIVANVSFFESQSYGYAHVQIRLGYQQTPDAPWEMSSVPDGLRVEYQTHSRNRDLATQFGNDYFRAARGFMLAAGDEWSEAYGETFETRSLEGMAYFAKLLQRGKEAGAKRFRRARQMVSRSGEPYEGTHHLRARGDALTLIVGLRAIGIPVYIWSKRIREIHERRASRDERRAA